MYINYVVRTKYVEQELAKKRGKIIDIDNQLDINIKHAEDQLYVIPEHLKVRHEISGHIFLYFSNY